MIANVVSGRVAAASDENVVQDRLIPAFQQAQGYHGGYWLRQPNGDEIIAVTFWESEDTLQAALRDPVVQEATAYSSSMFIGGPKMTQYRLVAQG
jgi:heme-degrading monooxygenase HmoA